MVQMQEESRLIERVLAGERQAYVQFVEAYKRLVYAMVARVIDIEVDREDVCQEIFVKAFDKLHTFDGRSKVSTWLASMSYRHALNHRRKHYKHQLSDIEDVKNAAVFGNSSGTADVEKKDLKELVMQFISQLPEKYQMAVTLFHQQEMDYKEIESITGWPEGTVKSYLFRGRKLLKEKIRTLYEKELMH